MIFKIALFDNKSRVSIFKISVLLSLIFFTPSPLYSFAFSGAPSAEESVNASQPDGKIFQVILKGDECRSWHETNEGYSVLFLKEERTWYYAICSSDDFLIASKYKVGVILPKGWPKHLRPNVSQCGKAER